MAVETGSDGPEVIDGTPDADTLSGLGGNDTINGEGGDDSLVGGLGADLIDGGAGNDSIEGTTNLLVDEETTPIGADTLIGGEGDDSINGYGNNTLALGGSGNDSLFGGPGASDDTLDGGTGADLLRGQGGADIYIVDNVLDVVEEFTYDSYGAGNTATGDVDEIRSTVSWVLRDWNDDGYNIENLTLLGSSNINATANEVQNVVTGNSGNNELLGLAGDDTIDGAAGNDTIEGGTGDDLMTGGSGADTFVFDALSGDDTITDYEDGVDVLDFSAFTQSQIDNQTRVETGGNTVISIGGATITLQGFIAPPPAPVFEYIIEGTDISERLEGDEGSNAIFGYNGNDTIIGNDGDDFLYDGQGTDSLDGGAGDDLYLVGSSADRVTEAANAGDDTVVSYGEDYTLSANVENLTVQTLGELANQGSAGTNTRDAAENPQSDGVRDALDDFDVGAFYNREGENFFNVPAQMNGTGNSLDNVITGNILNNNLNGGGGNDTIIGGKGADTMTGGDGADVFRFETAMSDGDNITDFQTGVDKIDLSGLNVNQNAAFSDGRIAGLETFGLQIGTFDIIGGGASTTRQSNLAFAPDDDVFVQPFGVSGTFNIGLGLGFAAVGLLAAAIAEGGSEDAADDAPFEPITGRINYTGDGPLDADDFILSDRYDTGVKAAYTDGIYDFDATAGLTDTLSIAAGYGLGVSLEGFGQGDVLEVGLGGVEGGTGKYDFNVGLAYSLAPGVRISTGYEVGGALDEDSIIKEATFFGVNLAFSTATDGVEEDERILPASTGQGVILGLDRDFDGTVDLEVTLDGDYAGAQFRTEYVNDNLVLTLRDGNSGPTGTLQLDGTPRVLQNLEADISNLFDRDGIVLNTVTYQWLRNGEEISGATDQTYRLGLSDVGKVINVEMTYEDAFGTTETVLSETSVPIGVADLPATGTVTIDGTVREGETLTANTSDVSDPNFADPTSATYQWLRDGQAIDGATGFEYTLGQNDVGARISVVFSFDDFSGGSEQITSVTTLAVENVNDAATGRVEITGKVIVGETLQADLSDINDLDGRAGASSNASYVWLRDGAAISGATAASYAVAEADLTADISVRVTFADDEGSSETLTSATIVAPIPGEAREGTPESDNLVGTAGEDMLNGLASDDQLSGGASDDMLDGGEGMDTAQFAGSQSHYTVTLDASGVTVKDRRDADAGGQGTDFLTNVEFLDFGTETAAFGGVPVDLTQFGNVASLSSADFTAFVELYIAYFNRAPDAIGLFFWGTALQEGLGLEEIATLFFDQDETRATYPFLNDLEGFAKEVYSNVLGREFDQAGLDFWVGVLSDGSVGLPTFMLEIIRGAKAEPQPGDAPELTAQKLADVAYLSNKTDLGAYFSVIKGMSDVDNARAAMEVYNGSQDSIDASKAAIDQFYESALETTGGEFLFALTGVVDDPFAIA